MLKEGPAPVGAGFLLHQTGKRIHFIDVNETFRSLNVGLPEDILRRKLYGDLEGAVRLIDMRLARGDIPQGLRDCMTAQREMMLRTPPDYPYDRAQALARVRAYIPDFSQEEFDRRVEIGRAHV